MNTQPNFRHVMLRETRKDKKTIALLLDTYDISDDSISFVETDSPSVVHSGRYHALRDRTTKHHVTPDTEEERVLSQRLSRGIYDIVYRDTFPNPRNRKK